MSQCLSEPTRTSIVTDLYLLNWHLQFYRILTALCCVVFDLVVASGMLNPRLILPLRGSLQNSVVYPAMNRVGNNATAMKTSLLYDP